MARKIDYQRKAQFYLDFVEAENSIGFHAPAEAARILGESMNFMRMGQVALRDAGTSARRPRPPGKNFLTAFSVRGASYTHARRKRVSEVWTDVIF